MLFLLGLEFMIVWHSFYSKFNAMQRTKGYVLWKKVYLVIRREWFG